VYLRDRGSARAHHDRRRARGDTHNAALRHLANKAGRDQRSSEPCPAVDEQVSVRALPPEPRDGFGQVSGGDRRLGPVGAVRSVTRSGVAMSGEAGFGGGGLTTDRGDHFRGDVVQLDVAVLRDAPQ
jgi:hypothetical protein